MSLDNEVVLVVDDDPFQCKIISHVLKRLGIRHILTANGGEEALTLLGTKAVSILLTDLMMPGMDGPQFMRHLAKIGCRARIVLISAASADIQRSISSLGHSHGLDVAGFVHKPLEPDQLKKLLSHRPTAVTGNRHHHAKSADISMDISAPRLATAIRDRDIHPWYQPKVDIRHSRLKGVEALARWRMPDGTLVSPGCFIPAIETEGLATDLFFGMLEQVLADLQRWRAAQRVFQAAVNLSMDCAYELDLPERVGALLREYSIPPDQLVIEVTESRLMTDCSAALETLTRISLMGVRLSIDDFGTGHSGLSQVARLPFVELKLDGSFVQQAGRNAKADTIIESTVALGRSLDMLVVAEGVEMPEQLDTLRSFGADLVQGYLIAKPMPAKQLDEWIEGWQPGLASLEGD